MNLDLAEGGVVEFVQQAVKDAAEIFGIEPRKELCNLLLRDRGGQINIPRGQAGEGR
jgi:hypothetical protein